VKKNGFLFFEKGRQMVKRRNSPSILGFLLYNSSNNLSKNLSIFPELAQNSNKTLKFKPNASDSNGNLLIKTRKMRKIGKIVDPILQKVFFSQIPLIH